MYQPLKIQFSLNITSILKPYYEGKKQQQQHSGVNIFHEKYGQHFLS